MNSIQHKDRSLKKYKTKAPNTEGCSVRNWLNEINTKCFQTACCYYTRSNKPRAFPQFLCQYCSFIHASSSFILQLPIRGCHKVCFPSGFSTAEQVCTPSSPRSSCSYTAPGTTGKAHPPVQIIPVRNKSFPEQETTLRFRQRPRNSTYRT